MVLNFSENGKLKTKPCGNINFISIFNVEKLQKSIATDCGKLRFGL